MYIYNTLTRKKELFTPIEKNNVRFYQCGPTVYWTQHIGNMRAMVWADFIRSTFQYLGYSVAFVRNYTDVGHLTSDADEGEDKMAKGARREGKTPQQIADKYIEIFEHDLAELNTLTPTIKPRATEYIQEMQSMVQKLVNKGYAYTTDYAVYYDVTRFADYTKLSRQKLEENITGAGKGEVSDSQKKHAADFALWFFKAGVHKNALQYWPSTFASPLVHNGEGFPGWHIECSVMSQKNLGETLDIHMGGVEHIPVHHTNEIAQSEAANEAPFVHYWIHNEHLLVNDKKMAKSEGTGYTLGELTEKGYHPLALRYFFMQSHYRSQQNFTFEALTAAQNALNNFLQQLLLLHTRGKGNVLSVWKQKFKKALEDDINMPQALAVVHELLGSKERAGDKIATLLNFDTVLGLRLNEFLHFTLTKEQKKQLQEYDKLRRHKEYKKSDELRDALEQGNLQLSSSSSAGTVAVPHNVLQYGKEKN